MTKDPKSDKELSSKPDELHQLTQVRAERIEGAMEAYCESRARFQQHVTERSARLDALSTIKLDAIRSSERFSSRGMSHENPANGSVPRVIFPVDPCATEFDAKELSLRPSRGKFSQLFYKVLLFNHPFGTTFFRNGWYLGQILRFRQEWRPAGFSIGELVHSTSLAPLEKAVFEVSNWEKTRKEIEEMEESTKKQELAQSSQSTDSSEISSSSSSTFEWYVDAHAEVGWGCGSASLDAGMSGSSENTASSMRSSINEQCRSSANSISRSRAVKVTMSQESGSEQRTVRTLENTNRCHTLTLNIFQLNKLYDLVVTYLDSPLCLIMPYARQALGSPNMQAMFSRLNEGLRDVRSIYNVVTHYMVPNPRVAAFLHTKSMDQHSPAPFGEGVTVLEFTTYDPRAIREGLIYFFGLVYDENWNPGADLVVFDDVIAQYMLMENQIRDEEVKREDRIVDTLEILTRGLYMDSMLGKCSACEDYITVSRSNEALKDFAMARELELQNALLEKEVARRQALLDNGIYDPFEPPVPKEMTMTSGTWKAQSDVQES